MKDKLKQCHLFAQLSEPQLERISQRAAQLRLEEGESLFEQGDEATRFYLLVDGLIKLYRLSPAGNEKVIEVVMPGTTFAEALMFLERPNYPVGAQALQPSTVISVDAADFASMLRNSVDTCFLLLAEMSQRLRGLLREIDELSLHSATCRVAAYLVQHASTERDTFDLPVAKQVLASRLSVKPETFSRIIKSLTGDGIISVDSNHITIHDREALLRAADVCAVNQDTLASTFIYPCPPGKPSL